jgi:prepilin-type N-terminal cleavage/methylation domain-containing protein
MNSSNKHNLGFSLIELSIVLLIISSLIALVMFSVQTRMDSAKTNLTKQRLQTIMDSIDMFVALYGHIPCPALRVAKTAANYGVSYMVIEPATGWGNECPASGANRLGDVPFKTLGLDPQITVDAWGNRIDYLITGPYAARADFLSPSTEWAGRYQIHNQHNAGTLAGTDIAYVLYSHGPNEYGGLDDNSLIVKSTLDSLGATAASPKEVININIGDINYHQSPTPYLDGTKIFDDILVYKTRWNLPKYINQ